MISLTKNGQVFMWGEFSVPIPAEDGIIKQEQSQINALKQLNFMTPIHLSYEGTLYCWGDDTQNKYGILGLGNQYKAQRPCPNSQLFDYMIKSISLAETHSCAVDSTGRLFCWGYGPNGELGLENQVQQVNVPTIVTKQKQITIKKAVANSTYTVFCSSAGYVFLFGTLHPQIGRMQMSSTVKFSTSQFKLPMQQSIDKTMKDQQNQQMKQTNKPINAMTQIISLSETFISDMICGDSFILCVTSNGDLYFVDDALESVQLSIQPVESIAISGSKILGITQSNKLYEWSTAGLNKLSFNKENKMLLRQDFQIKEYQITEEFNKNVRLCNLPLLKNQIGLIFEDITNQSQSYKESIQSENNDEIKEQQIILAKITQLNNKPQHYNPLCNDSSLNDTQDQIEEDNFKTAKNMDSNENQGTILLQTSPDSFKNDSYTPEISLAVNEFKSQHNQQPSFRVENQTFQDNNPSQFMNTREINNIFNFNSDNIARTQSTQQALDSPSLVVQQQIELLENTNDNEETNIIQQEQYMNDFKPLNSQVDFFMHSQNNLNLEIPSLNQNYPYRPSSIKSYCADQTSDNKSSNNMLFNHNSSPSMKQCTEQMMVLGNKDPQQFRNSKIELSYPSFLNNSQDTQQQILSERQNQQDYEEEEEQQITDTNQNYDKNEQVQVQVYTSEGDEDDDDEDEQIQLIDQSHTPVQISIQQHQDDDEEEENKNDHISQNLQDQDEQRVEYQIKFNNFNNNSVTGSEENQNKSQQSICSREASIVRTTRKVDEGIEESMEITIDNIKIRTRRTTTPKRILNTYSQNKRLFNQSQLQQQSNHSEISNSKASDKDKSSLSQHSSELSDGFNITQNSASHIDRRSNLLKNHQKANVQQPQNTYKLVPQKSVSSNSCEQFKKRSFMHAMINNRKYQLQNEYNKVISNTQIYEINPLKDESQISMHQSVLQQSNEDQNVILNVQKTNDNAQAQPQPQISIQDESEGIYYVFGDQTSQGILNQSNQQQLLSLSQIQNLQQRYSNLVQNNQNQLPPRESFGRMTHQTEDNLEIEYTISNSCTPESIKQQSVQSNIKRRINFDEASAYDGGCVIRVSDVNSANNRLINSFTLNLNQPNKNNDTKSEISSQVPFQKSSYPYQQYYQQNQQHLQTDQSQSFIFNQSQNSICPQVQHFNEENMVSNIKSVSTPSHNGNTTHIMMLTEEKFKNLKSEISHQQDQINAISNFIVPQVNLHHSPYIKDATNTSLTPRNDQSNQIRGSNIQNISSFMVHQKYFQVYENYRRGLALINEVQNKQLQWAFNNIRQISHLNKQKEQKILQFIKIISQIMKNAVTNQKYHGFKRIKKINKEKQLRVFIQQKQKQFAKQTSALVKVDSIILINIHQNLQYSFKAIFEYYQQLQKVKQEKRQRALNQLFNVLIKKNKQTQEKALRSIFNWANEKRLIEMNVKMLQRVINKQQNKQRQNAFNQINQFANMKQKLAFHLTTIHELNLKQTFKMYKEKVQMKNQLVATLKNLVQKFTQNTFKAQQQSAIRQWKLQISMQKRAVIALEMMSHIHEQQQKYKYFKKFRQIIDDIKIRQKYLRSMKPSLLLLFKKLDEIKKNNYKYAFQSLVSYIYLQEDTMLINKSGAQTNLSFTLQQPVEMSLILNQRNKGQNVHNNNVFNKSSNKETGSQTSRTHYRTQQQPAKSAAKQNLQGLQKQNYQTNLYQNQTQIMDKSSSKKPKLNDYLSFTPGSGSNQKQGTLNNTKFFNHKRNDAGYSSARNQTKSKVINDIVKAEKQYLDCPIPLKDYQDKQSKKNSVKQFQQKQEDSTHHQQSYENLNQLNVSIKDMNKAFRDQISRIKEKQQEDIDKSYMSSVNNMFGQDQSFDNQMNQLQIELTQTPDQLYEETENNHKKKLIFDNYSKNISPKINPLCTSESYQMFRGTNQNPYGVQQYSVEQKNHLQSYQTSNPPKIYSQAPQSINQDYYQHQASMIILSDKINDHQLQDYNTVPQTSTFGELRLQSQNSNDEDVEGSNEEKFETINRTKNPISSREGIQRQPSDPGSNFAYGSSNITKKKSDQRYQMNSVLDHEYSVDIEQNDMFDELEKQEQDQFQKQLIQHQQQQQQQIIHRVQSANNISNVQNSIANLSKKLDQTNQSQIQQNEVSQDFLDIQKKLMQKKTFDMRQQFESQQPSSQATPIQYAFQIYQDQQKKQDDINNQIKILHISPKFDESFVPSQLNRELLNEMAANYQMLELTPDGDYNMLIHNKSVFRREESVYSSNQYAEPIEMAMSPRTQIPDVSAINHQNLTTNQSQLNCYGMVFDVNKDKSEDNDYDDEYQEQVSQLIDYGRESRPYDFELSSNSKYKIISENQYAKQVLTTESAQPSIMIPNNDSNANNINNTSNICKKLSFGYDKAKKNNQLQLNKQKKSTLIVSGGEQTINFNLTQEEDNSFQMVDYDDTYKQNLQQNQKDIDEEEEEDELDDVGEEIPTEQIQKVQKTLPESRILQQELQEEKFNMTLSHNDLMSITQNRLQKLQNYESQAQTHREMGNHQRNNLNGQDFIQNNIQKLRNMIKASPRYQGIETNQSEDFNTRINSANQSTKNATSSNNILYAKKNQQQIQKSYDIPQQFQTQVSRQSNASNNFLGNNDNQQHIYRSFAFNQTTNLSQNIPNQQIMTSITSNKTQSNTRKPKTQYLMPSTARNPSKENRGQTNLSGGFAKILGERKPSITQQQPSIINHNQQQILRENLASINNQRKSSSGSSYQPLTFRAPVQHLSNNNVQQHLQQQQQQQQQQYNSFGGVTNNNVNISYHSGSQSRQMGSQNNSSVSNNNSRIMSGSGNATLNNTSGNNIMQERRISHQDISVNLSGGQGIHNTSGFASQKSSQQSLTGRSRNQADKLQTLLSMGSKVIQQNVSQIYRNSQQSGNSQNLNQNYNNLRQSSQTNRNNYN